MGQPSPPPLPDRPVALGAWVDELALVHGERPALIADGDVVTFRDLSVRSRRLAGGLARLGIGPGDRVAIWLPNVPAWIELLVACGRLGAIAVSLNTRFRSLEAGDILARSGARALVLWPGFPLVPYAEILAEVDRDQLAGLETIIVYDPSGEEVPSRFAGKATVGFRTIAAQDPWTGAEAEAAAGCLILTTSGTTKKPKFVLHSQQGLVTHVRDVAAAPDFYGTPGSTGLAVMPLCGAFGLTQTLGALAGGAPTVLQLSFDPARTAEAVWRHGVTNMGAVDDVFYKMLDLSEAAVPFPSLRWVVYGSFNSSPRDFIRIADARGLKGIGAYGMSEFQGLFSLQPLNADADRRARGGGFPVSAAARVRVRDTETGLLLPPGEAGELEVSAPSMMLGYYGDSAATEEAFTEDGFLRTGDSGSLTTDGGFEFLARMGDTLRLGGFLVSPVEIAEHIERHPAVAECQVVGAHGPSGYRPVAFLIPTAAAEADEAELAKHCRRSLAKFKIPARFLWLDEFPTTDGPNGRKVQRATLRQMAEAALR